LMKPLLRFAGTLFVVVTLGCESGVAGPTSAPATRRATPATTQHVALKPIDLWTGVYLARIDISTTITADGVLRRVQIMGKSYGPKDLDPKHEQREIREGRLTTEQRAELAQMFSAWDSFSTERHGGVADGGEIRLRYGDKTVSGGSATPEAIWKIRARIDELARSMPIVEK
jgi:hypothetical protein